MRPKSGTQLQRAVDHVELERAAERMAAKNDLVVTALAQARRDILREAVEPRLEPVARAMHELIGEQPVIQHVGQQQEPPRPHHQPGEDRESDQRREQIGQRQAGRDQQRGRIDRRRREAREDQDRIDKEQPVTPVEVEIAERRAGQDEIGEGRDRPRHPHPVAAGKIRDHEIVPEQRAVFGFDRPIAAAASRPARCRRPSAIWSAAKPSPSCSRSARSGAIRG